MDATGQHAEPGRRDGLKAVCYRCRYEGRDPAATCPICRFPVILEPESTPPAGTRLEEIFARESVGEGAPPLPGVHVGPRKAQILAEARRRRLAEKRATASAAARGPEAAGPELIRAETIRAEMAAAAMQRTPRLKIALLCASAVFAGVLAAVLTSSF